MHYPSNGGKQAPIGAIAKAMNLPSHRIYRIKKLVENKLAPLVRSE
jgi:hypothetical protein